MNFFDAFNRPGDDGLVCEPGLTRQADLYGCDVNNIIRRYLATGQLPSNGREPRYMDCTSINFQEMQNQIADAYSDFMMQPWSVNFGSVEEFLAFSESLENGDARAIELARKYGILKDAVPEDKDLSTPKDAQPTASASKDVGKSTSSASADSGGGTID